MIDEVEFIIATGPLWNFLKYIKNRLKKSRESLFIRGIKENSYRTTLTIRYTFKSVWLVKRQYVNCENKITGISEFF